MLDKINDQSDPGNKKYPTLEIKEMSEAEKKKLKWVCEIIDAQIAKALEERE